MRHEGFAAKWISRTGLLALLCTITPLVAQAQSASAIPDDYLKWTVPQIQAKTAEIISGSMNFTDAESKAFWPVYKRYEVESGAITDRLVALLKDYEANVKTLTDAKANELARRVFEIDEQKIRLNKKYYREFCKSLPAPRVFQFFQLMRRIDTLLNMRIATLLPMIGEDW